MRNLVLAAVALVAFALPAAAFDFNASGVIGNGASASASSSSGLGYSGDMGSISALAGVGASSFTASQNQSSWATSNANGNVGGSAWAETNTGATGWSKIDTASGALGLAAAGNVGAFQSVNGSDGKASAFGGFGAVFDFNTGN